MSQRKQAEQAALKQLEIQGADTDTLHPVEFFLYFSTEWNAYVAATQLMNLQFKVSVSASKGSEQWLCLATKKLEPTSERLTEVSNFVEGVADSNSGAYDGWGTPIVE